ncbi:MAG TPA: glutathione binding-like protein [Nevskiaceae bacterium]
MKLYFAPGTCSMASWISLEWIGKPYETHKVEIHGTKSPELLEHNPMGAVPTLEDDAGNWWTQNVAVLNYLADSFPQARIGSDGTPKGRADLNRWLGFLTSDMHQSFKPLFGAIDGTGDAKTIDAIKAKYREALKSRFGLLDKHLAGGKWALGDHHSVADAYLFVMTTWAPKVGVDIGGFHNLQDFIKRMRADPAVKHVLAEEAKEAA